MWSVLTWMRNLITEYTWFWWSSNESKNKTILLIGLDDAGKTTLTGRLTQNRLIQPQPTGKPSTHEVKIGSTLLAITDVGGHQQARRLWRDYMFASTRLIFILDASNRQRLPEARHELLYVLNDDDIRSMPILILANKIDNINTAYGENELKYLLQIEKYLNEENPRVKLCMCSVSRNEGFSDGLRWLINQPIKLDS
jgi:GTP-binding protein SAR1